MTEINGNTLEVIENKIRSGLDHYIYSTSYLISGNQPSFIVCLNDNGAVTPFNIDNILTNFTHQGYSFVTFETCFNDTNIYRFSKF